jgi:hypothetical protein
MEHVFISELLQHRWFIDQDRVEVIRPEVDADGFDLVLEANKHVRHVQLKSRVRHGQARSTRINARLREHPDPCVVWVFWRVDPATCRVSVEYKYSPWQRWPPLEPGEPTFVLKWADFLPDYVDIEGLVSLLF